MSERKKFETFQTFDIIQFRTNNRLNQSYNHL